MAGLVLEVAAIFLILILARSILGLVRSVPAARSNTERVRAWAILWRALAIGFAVWFINSESHVLRIDSALEIKLARATTDWGGRYRLAQGLFPVCAVMAMIGLLLGAGAGTFLDEPRPLGRRPVTLFVLVAALAGVLIMGAPQFDAIIVHLVLIALEALSNALYHRLIPGPGLAARLLGAGIHAGVAWLAGVALAIVLARDFEHARHGQPWAITRRAWFLRLGFLATAAALALHVALVTIPAINGYFAEGFLRILGRTEVGMILCGVGLFAAGAAARTLFPRQAGEKPVWLARASDAIRWLILGLGILWFLVNATGAAHSRSGHTSRDQVGLRRLRCDYGDVGLASRRVRRGPFQRVLGVERGLDHARIGSGLAVVRAGDRPRQYRKPRRSTGSRSSRPTCRGSSGS